MRASISKSNLADPRNTSAWVHLTLLFVDVFMGEALAHTQSDSRSWWLNEPKDVDEMAFQRLRERCALVDTGSASERETPNRPSHNSNSK